MLIGYTKKSGSLTHRKRAGDSSGGLRRAEFCEEAQERGHFLAGLRSACGARYLRSLKERRRGGIIATTAWRMRRRASPAARAGFGLGGASASIEERLDAALTEAPACRRRRGVSRCLLHSVAGVAFGIRRRRLGAGRRRGYRGVQSGLRRDQRGRLNLSPRPIFLVRFRPEPPARPWRRDFVSASAEPDGHALSGSLQVSYDIAEMLGMPGWLVAPTARLNAISAHRDGFTEEGADILDLTVEEDDLSQVLPAAGISLGATWSSGGLV